MLFTTVSTRLSAVRPLLAVALAGSLLLAACSNDEAATPTGAAGVSGSSAPGSAAANPTSGVESGTGTGADGGSAMTTGSPSAAASDTGSSSTAPSSLPTSTVPTSVVPTSAVPTSAVPTSAVPTSAVPTSAVPTSAVPTSAVPTSAVPTSAVPTSVAPSSRPPKPTPTSPKPSGTGALGAFTPRDTAWFGALCTGLSGDPRQEFAAATGGLAAKRSTAGTLLTGQAQQLNAAVATMKKVGAPTVEDGQKLADAVLAFLPKAAAAAQKGAASVVAAGDEKSLRAAFQSALQSIDDAKKPLQNFNEMMAAPAMESELAKIPSCRPLVG
jgi:hypothetical protein